MKVPVKQGSALITNEGCERCKRCEGKEIHERSNKFKMIENECRHPLKLLIIGIPFL